MDKNLDLLHQVVDWADRNGWLGITLAWAATAIRWITGYDRTATEALKSLVSALFVLALIAPGLAWLIDPSPPVAAMIGAVLGMTARPLIEGTQRLARLFRDDVVGLIDALRGRR
jgi:hypothetical protein